MALSLAEWQTREVRRVIQERALSDLAFDQYEAWIESQYGAPTKEDQKSLDSWRDEELNERYFSGQVTP